MRILFLDDDPRRHEAFRRLSVGNLVDHVTTAAEAIRALREKAPYDLVALDHDLGGRTYVDSDEEETGYQVAKAVGKLPQARIPGEVIVHSFNPAGVERMVSRLRRDGVKATAAPFGTWHCQFQAPG